MSLESMYNNAAPNTYAGTVRTRQAADASVNLPPLVNFLDGKRVTTPEPDAFQTEFTRNEPNAYVAGGVPKHPEGNLTRWTSNAFKLAFDGYGPPSLDRGYYTSGFRRLPDGRMLHNYTPNLNKNFGTLNASAKSRIAASPSGAPAGL
jgi:hypothetical protein